MEKENGKLKSQGLAVSEWCECVGVSRATFYNLPPEFRPHAVKIGDRTVVFEKPLEWLKRAADAGGISTRKRAVRS